MGGCAYDLLCSGSIGGVLFMKQIGAARLYDETEHFKCVRTIYQQESDGRLFIMRKNNHVNFWQIPITWKIEYTVLF